MDNAMLLACIRDALGSITAPRYFETERGFQGALLVELTKRIPDRISTKGALIEQEYQKRLAQHGLNIRPDIIIHQPFCPDRHTGRDEGNIAVIELKLNATEAEAIADFKNLVNMIDVLHYPMGVFINIGSPSTHAGIVPDKGKGYIVTFAAYLQDGHTCVVEEKT